MNAWAALRRSHRPRLQSYCINLRRSESRRHHMERQFAAAGWPVSVVPAVDGPNSLDLEDLLRDGTLSPEHEGLCGPLTLAEIGCYLSHELVWRLVQSQALPHALVCEDDLEFRRPPPPLSRLIEALPEDCDVLYLYYLNAETNELTARAFDPANDLPVASLDGWQVFSAWSCGGTQCYLVTARGATKLLAGSRPIQYPVDGYMGRLSFAGWLRVYALHPMAVHTGAFASTIG